MEEGAEVEKPLEGHESGVGGRGREGIREAYLSKAVSSTELVLDLQA